MPDNERRRNRSARDPSSISTGLLARLKTNQPGAWQRLAELYGPVVFHWCRRANLQSADADDVVQEVFRTVFAKVATFRREREGDTFCGWLWTITRHKIGDHIRRSRRQPIGTGGDDGARLIGETADLPEEVPESIGRETGGLYQQVLETVRDEFRPPTWEAFRLVVMDGQAPAIVAERLRTTPNAVYLAKSRVLRRIRQELGDLSEDNPSESRNG